VAFRTKGTNKQTSNLDRKETRTDKNPKKKMIVTLVLSSLLFLTVRGLFKRGDVFAQQAYHLEDFEVKSWAPPPSHLQNALDQQISIQFSTKDLIFDLDLTLNHFIYNKNTKIFSSRRDENGEPLEIEKEYNTYQGNATIRARVDNNLHHRSSQTLVTTDLVSVTFFPDKRAHILVITPDDIYTWSVWKYINNQKISCSRVKINARECPWHD